jgi:hypothetical protein
MRMGCGVETWHPWYGWERVKDKRWSAFTFADMFTKWDPFHNDRRGPDVPIYLVSAFLYQFPPLRNRFV